MFIPILINGLTPSMGVNILYVLSGTSALLVNWFYEEKEPTIRRKGFYPHRVECINSKTSYA